MAKKLITLRQAKAMYCDYQEVCINNRIMNWKEAIDLYGNREIDLGKTVTVDTLRKYKFGPITYKRSMEPDIVRFVLNEHEALKFGGF